MGSASLAAARPTARPDRDDNTPKKEKQIQQKVPIYAVQV